MTTDEAPEQGAKLRQVIGIFAGLAAAVIVFLLFPASAATDLNAAMPNAPEGPFDQGVLRFTAGVAVLMAIWWMTEAIPLAATALVPLVAFPIAGAADFADIAVSYSNPTILLFLGGFIMALGLQRWNLHRRMAYSEVLLVGTRPKQMILGFMIATGGLSMWISNTATALVMLPIGMSVLALTAKEVGGFEKQRNFATGLMLAIACSASIGSLGTIIGTPPTTMAVAYMADTHGVEIGFGQWMLVGVPVAVILLGVAWFVLTTVFKPEMDHFEGGRALIKDELRALGPMSRGEITAGVIFLSAATCWVFLAPVSDALGWENSITDSTIAIAGALLMFLIPADSEGRRVMDWEHTKDVQWGVLLLYGGGIALSSMFGASGLSQWIGQLTGGLSGLPIFLVVLAVVALILVMTEFSSNVATAATFLPIMGSVALGMGIGVDDPTDLILIIAPVALAATCAFMLPVSSAPNAIAYSSGYVRIGEMVRGGIWLNLAAITIITAATFVLIIPVFGISLP